MPSVVRPALYLSNASCPRSSIEHSLVGEHQRCCVALYVAAHGYRYARVQFNTVPKFDTLRALMPACPHRVRPPIDDIHTTAPSAEDRVVRLTPHLSTRTPCNYTSTQPTILLSLNFISDQCFPFLGKFHDVVYSFKVYVQARCWREECGCVVDNGDSFGRYRAGDGRFYRKLSLVGRLFQNAPTYRPVTLICSRNKMLGGGEGAWQK